MIAEDEVVNDRVGGDELLPGMTESVNAKHLRIRGTLAFKYPPKESRCRGGCGVNDYQVKDFKGDVKTIEHPCFLAIRHEGPCEFSSECVTSK